MIGVIVIPGFFILARCAQQRGRHLTKGNDQLTKTNCGAVRIVDNVHQVNGSRSVLFKITKETGGFHNREDETRKGEKSDG